MLLIIVSPPPGASKLSGFTCLIFIIRLENIFFPKKIKLSCVCDFVLLCIQQRIFPKHIKLSCVCDFFFFSFYITTITLEGHNQSEPNFHTQLLSRIARQVRKWASQVTCNPLPPPNRGLLPPPHPTKINIPPVSTNPNQIFTHDFCME